MYLYYMNKLEKIQNPKTGKWFNINSKTGKMVLENYINILHMEGGARSPAALRQEEQLRKKRLALWNAEQQAMANRAAERARVAGKKGESRVPTGSAVQAGAGVHFNLSPRLDLSFVTQYMLHLGNEIHTEVHEGQLEFYEEEGSSFEGHLLFHLSINYKIADLW